MNCMLLLMVKKHDCLKHPLLFIFSFGFKYLHAKKSMSFNTLHLIFHYLHINIYIYIPSCTCMSVFFWIQAIGPKKPKLDMDSAAVRRLWLDRFAALHSLIQWQQHLKAVSDHFQSAILEAREFFAYTDQAMIQTMSDMMLLVQFMIENLIDLIAHKQVELWSLSLQYAQLRQQELDDRL